MEVWMEFDIHGSVGIRVEGATDVDGAALVYQLGPPQPLHGREPDITIRFQDRLERPDLVYLGLNEMAFDHSGFYVLGRRDGMIKARIPFEAIGQPCDILCRRGIGDIPLLYEIIMFTLLGKGYLPVHGAAFRYRGKGILVVGWTKGGKTESLLSFANHGAEYVGDECVVIDRDGQEMFGLPYPVTLWDWQFGHIPDLLPPIGVAQRLFFNAIGGLDAIYRSIDGIWPAWTRLFTLLGRMLPTLGRQRKVVHPPHTLFRGRICQKPVAIDRVFLALSHSTPDIRVEPCAPREIAQRMRHSNEVEQSHLMNQYKAFRYAFPQLQNDLLEEAGVLQEQLLHQALVGKEAYAVYHPYPVEFERLFARMQPLCE